MRDHQETLTTAAGPWRAATSPCPTCQRSGFVEAEAAARQVTRLQAFEDTLADIDREPTPEEVRKYGLDGSPGTSFNTLQWKLDRFRLLSAGDKAEAPLPDPITARWEGEDRD